MIWKAQGGSPWGTGPRGGGGGGAGGNGGGPWGPGRGGGSGGGPGGGPRGFGPRPPDLEDLLRRSQERLRGFFGYRG